jgi:hypothetical protein
MFEFQFGVVAQVTQQRQAWPSDRPFVRRSDELQNIDKTSTFFKRQNMG